jgi:hypothetical protein
MAEIVGGLFGVSPEQLMRQRQATDTSNAFRFAQLSPMERAQMSIYQGGAGLGRAAQGLLGGDPELERVSQIKQLSSQFDLSTPQGARQFAQALQPFAPQEAMMAVREADRMEQAGLGRQKTAAETTLAEARTQQAEAGRLIQVDLGDRIQLVNALTQEVVREVPKGLTPAQAAKQAAAGTASATGVNLGKLTPAQKAVDTKFSKEYTDFVSAGGSTTITKNLEMLDNAIKIIEDEPDGATSGKIVGLSDKTGTISYTHPKAAEAKDLIGGVAQSNLRAVLGGQFAAREGEQLLARAYNTAQPKADNLRRLRSLRKQIEDAAAAKVSASQYYEENGTLKGFKGKYSVTPETNTPAPTDQNQAALDWLKANPNDPRAPAIRQKLGIQ